MRNKLVLAFILVTSCAITTLNAQKMTPEMEEFLNKIDGANLTDIEAELNEGLKGLRAFSGMFDVTDATNILDYDSGELEEKYDDSFKIDTTIVTKAMLQFDNMGFRQSFKNGKTQVKFQKIGDDYWNSIWMEEGMSEAYSPKAIHYKDGTSILKGISDYKTSFFFEEPWGDIAVIDSIDMDYTITYTAAYDSLVLTKKSKKVKYKDGAIKVKKLEKNFLYITIEDEFADGIYVNALNAEGKVLNSNSSSFSPTADDKAGDGISQILKMLEEVQVKLNNKDFKDTDDFKKYLLKKASKIEQAKDTDGIYHKKFYFQGNIETVKVYIQTKGVSKTISFTAKNNSGFGDIIFTQNKTENIFLDANAKELFRTEYSPIESLGSRYFKTDSLYYHLNLSNQKLDELKVAYVWEATNGLAFIQKKKDENLFMYNAEFELLSDTPYKKLYAIDQQFVQGIGMQNENYILSATGKSKELLDISGIRDPFDGRMAAKSNDKYGFIATSGKVIIPFEYSEVENFKHGHAIVSKGPNEYGIIDTYGKIVIPLKYSRILSHKNGFTWVSTEDDFQLLKDGKVLLTEEGSSYSMSSSNSDITLQFGDKKYDGYGNLIPEEKTDN